MRPLRERYADIWDVTSFTGPAGTVELCPLPEVGPDDPPQWRSTIGTWLCDCPGQSPAWRHYFLSAVHLRPVPGETQPAVRRTPESTHEILVIAVDPSTHPVPAPDMFLRGQVPALLRPLNVVEQIEGATDEEARVLLTLCARAVAHGMLPAEPPFPGRDRTWIASLDDTLACIKLGGHPGASS